VPAIGPAETESPAGNWTNAPAVAGLPGKGLAQHPMLYVGENFTKMFLVNNGKVIWTYQTGKGYEYDDVWMLSNGNILFTRMQYVAEITPDKKVVWPLRLRQQHRDQPHGGPHLPAHRLGQGDVRPERHPSPADGGEHEDRGGGGQSGTPLRPTLTPGTITANSAGRATPLRGPISILP